MNDELRALAAVLGKINRPSLSGHAVEVEAMSWIPMADGLLDSQWLADRLEAAYDQGRWDEQGAQQ